MSMERRKTVNHGVGADFSRTCEGCSCITVETVDSVSVKGRFLPYVPAWCPLMEENLKK